MIFVTIGTQEPFDRLIKVMDELAATVLKGTEVIAQTFETDYKIENMKALNFVPSTDFDAYFNAADLIVSHAGMGTIISALVQNKPIIVMPRLMLYDEHRNEHQLATAKKFDELGYVEVAYSGDELKNKIIEMWPDKLKPMHQIGSVASDSLIKSLREFI
ncbi:glycosyltransferase [Mucilaginibacter pedocola]|uniref:Glycosyl transferase family 28 n=1 Tax=Mucilaginibacter pedocola TaxID=1792845 RepID=A0A1S9P800_9SPHI|nr:glycosyltransferase [Mucilaginibacter pedocola]OOQ57090.1 glycosyl transferase family 28 [Mucilaginibacter pedocola]